MAEDRRSAQNRKTVISFQDSNVDGTGDLPGLLRRVDYLCWIGDAARCGSHRAIGYRSANVVSFVGSNVGMTETLVTGTRYSNEADLPNAKVALDRVIIPEDTVDRITQLRRWPRSSAGYFSRCIRPTARRFTPTSLKR